MKKIKKSVNAQVEKVIPLIKDIYYGTEEDRLYRGFDSEKIIEKTNTVAESCTEVY